jgi:histone deacetylase 1/2
MTALHQHQLPPPPTFNAWDTQAFYTALTSAGVATHPPSASEWFLDTGASNHMSSGNLPNSRPLSSSIVFGNGARLPVTQAADISFPTFSRPLQLHNVLVSPSLVTNLVSVRQLTRDNNISIEFDPRGFSVKDLTTKQETLRCDSGGDLYPLRLPQPRSFTASAAPTVKLWHQRLGHPGSKAMSQVLHSFDFTCNKSEAHTCHSCQLGKHVRLPFSASETQSYFPFQLVHSDVWTSPVLSHSGFKYYVVFLDDFTHYIWVVPIRAKSEVFPIVRSFHSYVHTQFRLPLVALQTDNGREYDPHALRAFFSTHGISLRPSYPYTS